VVGVVAFVPTEVVIASRIQAHRRSVDSSRYSGTMLAYRPPMPSPSFAGSIPRTYHDCLGPMLFHAYADDLARRLAPHAPTRILETACGTGIVTQHLARAFPAATITATDLSQPMIDVAAAHLADDLAARRVSFQPVDACSLPFPDASFDAVVCQYGVMFFPDKVRAMAEARRVLRPGGVFLFNVWRSLRDNPIPGLVHDLLARRFPANPPQFLAQLPYGWSDPAEVERVTRAGGFAHVTLTDVDHPSVAPSADVAARAWLEGTPLFLALQERGVTDFPALRHEVAAALAAAFGDRPCRSTMLALIVEARA
jgi:SAM-dependent methyltransferase